MARPTSPKRVYLSCSVDERTSWGTQFKVGGGLILGGLLQSRKSLETVCLPDLKLGSVKWNPVGIVLAVVLNAACQVRGMLRVSRVSPGSARLYPGKDGSVGESGFLSVVLYI